MDESSVPLDSEDADLPFKPWSIGAYELVQNFPKQVVQFPGDASEVTLAEAQVEQGGNFFVQYRG